MDLKWEIFIDNDLVIYYGDDIYPVFDVLEKDGIEELLVYCESIEAYEHCAVINNYLKKRFELVES